MAALCERACVGYAHVDLAETTRIASQLMGLDREQAVRCYSVLLGGDRGAGCAAGARCGDARRRLESMLDERVKEVY